MPSRWTPPEFLVSPEFRKLGCFWGDPVVEYTHRLHHTTVSHGRCSTLTWLQGVRGNLVVI
jgi:hypothetical protein